MLFVDEAEPSDQSRDVGGMPADESVTSTMISIDIMEQRTDDRVVGRTQACYPRLDEAGGDLVEHDEEQDKAEHE